MRNNDCTFSEGATHVAINSKLKFAFTLAEVLITLGVIGVVATITLPVLIKEYQKHVFVNRLKKSISVVENGLKLAMAEESVDNLYNTSLFSFYNVSDLSDNGKADLFVPEINKYFNTVQNKKGIALQGNCLAPGPKFGTKEGVMTYLNDETMVEHYAKFL